MADLKIGDDVTHTGYPLGTLIEVRPCIGNGESFGLVRIHGHTGDAPTAIPMRELQRDTRHTEAAL